MTTRAELLHDILSLMKRWMQDGAHPYDASEAWGYFWGSGPRTAPGLRKLGFIEAMLIGLLGGLTDSRF